VSPLQKASIVRAFSDIGAKMVTGMCGDGGNDCAALRAATFGFALSESDAGDHATRNHRYQRCLYHHVQAGVVAPFSSGEKSLKGVTRLLAEGRCALATNFAAFKYNHTSVV
jgi:cation-transporting ATPase 13A3/4/5